MGTLSTSVQKIFRPVPNLGLAASKNSDIQIFLEQTTRTTIERALTEFAARICYNSVKKMGTAPNFVEKVLQSGHLSTAEHASLMLPVSVWNGAEVQKFSRMEMSKANRYFDFPKGYVAGNMRSWLEYMAGGRYSPLYEYIIAVFPDVFPSSAYVNVAEMYEFAEQAPVNVPIFEQGMNDKFNLYLLAVNFGELAVSRRPDTKLEKPWVRYTWLLEGVSRSLTHQLVRHRGASFSQESQRYVDFGKGQGDKQYYPFVYPEAVTEEQNAELCKIYWDLAREYETLRSAGLRKEDARFILPNGAATRLVVSFNLPELLHFLDIRCAKDAQWEIRRMAVEMVKQAYLATPAPELREILAKYDIRV